MVQVACTCLSTNSAMLARRVFDVCIVDEASQITLPATIGALLKVPMLRILRIPVVKYNLSVPLGNILLRQSADDLKTVAALEGPSITTVQPTHDVRIHLLATVVL